MKKLLKTVLPIFLLTFNAEAQEIFEQQNDQFVRSLDDSYVRGLLFLQSTQNEDGAWSDFRAINVQGTETVARLASENGVRGFIHVSSVMVYGYNYPQQVDEDGPLNGENNPYVQAFMEWWPELSKHLQEIRVTGGEPSASFNFWRFVDVMKKNPTPHLDMAVNSNLGVKKEDLELIIDSVNVERLKNHPLNIEKKILVKELHKIL